MYLLKKKLYIFVIIIIICEVYPKQVLYFFN